MIRISQIKLPAEHTKVQLEQKIKKAVHHAPLKSYQIFKRSLDARKKDQISYVYTIDAEIERESVFLKRNKNPRIAKAERKEYRLPRCRKEIPVRPVVIGMGPAGLFAALVLAKAWLKPILLERGKPVEERMKDVEAFWESGNLNPESNVQFGEGGAGTFSDGKLNTAVKDKYGRNRFVLETFVKYGAPEEILYDGKPHIGTDLLCKVVANMRNAIQEAGGTIRFENKVTDLVIKEGRMTALVINETETLPCDTAVLAVGHSARDTFEMLYENKLYMMPKSFAIGVRVEHLRQKIDESQYGKGAGDKKLPTASYKLTYRASGGRSVYSFCMCPGGFVVNASSEKGRLTVNGMSNHDRMARNSNSAIIASVTPEDFGSEHPLAGIEFQRKWEEKAYRAGNGAIPVQTFSDFKEDKKSDKFGRVLPNTKGKTAFANIRECLPDEISEAIIEGMDAFEKKIKGFSDGDTVLSGIEARTSSPLRMERDESFQSSIPGIYPCGEGAGYAGGITSAAMDGIKTAEQLIENMDKKYNIL